MIKIGIIGWQFSFFGDMWNKLSDVKNVKNTFLIGRGAHCYHINLIFPQKKLCNIQTTMYFCGRKNIQWSCIKIHLEA